MSYLRGQAIYLGLLCSHAGLLLSLKLLLLLLLQVQYAAEAASSKDSHSILHSSPRETLTPVQDPPHIQDSPIQMTISSVSSWMTQDTYSICTRLIRYLQDLSLSDVHKQQNLQVRIVGSLTLMQVSGRAPRVEQGQDWQRLHCPVVRAV